MKNLLSIAMLLMFSVTVHAQQDVTRFLGIPIDGSKSEMISKLKAKGYRSGSTTDELRGKFNGVDVRVYVVTNKDKVCRIMVEDANEVDERSIQIRFNKLCDQFANNSKYLLIENDQTIPDKENISYEMVVNKKRYEAVFYQVPDTVSSSSVVEKFTSIVLQKYTKEQLKNPTEEIKSDINKLIFELCSKKKVWFMISDHFGKYQILMFYDNEYNRANGEDL